MAIDPALLVLVAKMAGAALSVVLASVIAERTGPLLAALVVTLPVSAGPIYVILAMDHDAAFVSGSALASLSANIATATYCYLYMKAAQHRPLAQSLGLAIVAWLTMIVVLQSLSLPLLIVMPVMLLVFTVFHRLATPYLRVAAPSRTGQPWFAIPLRAGGVAALVGIVTTISTWAGPQWSGFIATFPVVLTSLIVILHRGIGGKATAAVIGNSFLGLMGFGFSLAAVHWAAVPIGKWWALMLGLAIGVVWNLGLLAWSRRG